MRIFIGFLITGVVVQLNALPSFARRYNLSCKQCHTVTPKLNPYGEAFSSKAYISEGFSPRFKTLEAKGDRGLFLSREVPVSARMRLFIGRLLEAQAHVYFASNLSSRSSFFLKVSPMSLDELVYRLNLPQGSYMMLGRFSLSRLFVREDLFLTYRSPSLYSVDSLRGIGGLISLTPYAQVGYVGSPVLRAGFSSSLLAFYLFSALRDSFGVYGLEFRVRLGPLDFVSGGTHTFLTELGDFDASNSFVSAYASLDVVLGDFFLTALYDLVTYPKREVRGVEHVNSLYIGFGHAVLRNLKASLEVGLDLTKRLSRETVVFGIVLDWST